MNVGQKRAERLELPTRKYPAVSAYFGVWVTVWVKRDFRGFFRQSKNPADRSLTGFFLELLSRFELETSSLPILSGLFSAPAAYRGLLPKTQYSCGFRGFACRFLSRFDFP